ncbi:isochorismate synthase [Synechococcus sp. 63AY4M2]|uniref:isochorismate synthase n=1 Tax=Synechococcus sp. 63AY4M2 TaxID=1353266 RepID=UPI001439001C|nr:isochorismate synthase [Synechococcus sp. 63AY4M2]
MTSSLFPWKGGSGRTKWPRAWPPIHASAGPAEVEHAWDPLLATCQEMARARGIPQILSLSQPISGLDPLAVLTRQLGLLPPNRSSSYCYLSHQAQGERVRVLGWGSLRQLDLSGEGRFQAARAFVQALQPHVHTAPGNLESPSSRQERPLCFCRFGFAPRSGGGAALVLPRWQLLQVGGELTVARLNLEVGPESDPAALAGQIAAFFARMQRLSQAPLPGWELQPPLPVAVAETPLLARIQKALQAIQAGSLEKVVLAEAVDLALPSPPPIPSLLAYLEAHHPDCSVFAFALESQRDFPPQIFLGASPERLLSVWQGRVQIDALAGSVARGANGHQDRMLAEQLLRSPKDRREHQWVVRSIQEALGRLGMEPRISPQPRLRRLANIQHLQTVIEAELPTEVHLFDLLAQLHPTAAVGGYPQQAALQWLEQWEPFDRSSYAAPLGWVDLQGNGELVVGIRSALIAGKRARLYAGAGIVADSNPAQELAEIRLKLHSLAQALALQPLPD